MLQQMKIGPKFLLTVGGAAVVVTAIGLYLVFEQERTKISSMLEMRAKIIQAQTEVTRAYIAKNYVAKIKNSSVSKDIQIIQAHADNPQAIPLPATATREISEELSKSGIFNARLISLTPLNQANSAKDGFETEALKAIMSGADSYARIEESNGTTTFRRATPDKAMARPASGAMPASKSGTCWAC